MKKFLLILLLLLLPFSVARAYPGKPRDLAFSGGVCLFQM